MRRKKPSAVIEKRRGCPGLDCIEYGVTVQISALQHGVCAHVRVCVRAFAVEIKPGMLRA